MLKVRPNTLSVTELKYKSIYRLTSTYVNHPTKTNMSVYGTEHCVKAIDTLNFNEEFMFLGTGPCFPFFTTTMENTEIPGQYRYIVEREAKDPSTRWAYIMHTTKPILGYLKCNKHLSIFLPVQDEDT